MTDDLKASTGTLAESTYDSQSGRIRQGSDGKREGVATSPRDTVAGTVEETPEGPSDRAGIEAEETARGQRP